MLEIGGNPSVVDNANPEVLALPAQHFAPRPRAKGVTHLPVPTKAMIDKHGLEQHVNYAPWCPHCLQASAFMEKHPLVIGESLSIPTVSADFCAMKGRDVELGDGIPVFVMRESQTRSLFSQTCAGKITSREGYSSFLIEKCVEDIDSVQKDMYLKTVQESAMSAFQAGMQQARKSRTTPANSPKGDHQTNGRAEKGVQAFQNIARQMRLAVGSHLGIQLPTSTQS